MQAFGVTGDDFTNLAPLVTVCSLSCLLPLPFLSLLPPSASTSSGVEPRHNKLDDEDNDDIQADA
jgi:hypothetical protein